MNLNFTGHTILVRWRRKGAGENERYRQTKADGEYSARERCSRLKRVWRGLQVCPSPFGRGWRGAPGEGQGMRQSWPSSGPFLRLRPVGLALRGATFSQGEKDTSSGFSLIWITVVID